MTPYFLQKMTKKIRFCVHYRKLNLFTVRYSNLLQRLEKSINSLVDPQVISTLDSSGGYLQM